MNQIVNELLKSISIRITYGECIGSGVLLSLDNKQVVITALHIFNNGQRINPNELSIERYEQDRLIKIAFSLIEYIPLEENDIALAHIKTEEKVEEIQFGSPTIDREVVITGYPAVLTTSKELKRFYLSGIIKELTAEKVFISVDDKLGSTSMEEKDHVDGFSGGGIFTVLENQLWLIGIETNVVTADVAYNLISGISIKHVFDKLVEQSKAFGISTDTINKTYDTSYEIKNSDYYRRNLLLISDFESGLSVEQMTDEYRAGIDARPDHIRHSLDIVRNEWMEIISKDLNELPILIIRGASGQGKTTLALRYLMNTYDENQIIVIRNIHSENNAFELIHYLKSITNCKEYIVFYDVNPGDSYWKFFLKEAASINVGTKILVAIREEDFNENSISKNEFSYNELHLWLTESEAQDIYGGYETKNYTSFENAWSEFGRRGPLLEFTYILNHSEPLEDKIRTQLRQIEEEEESSEWFLILGIIAIAGKYNVKIPIRKLFSIVQCKSKGRLLKRFIKELFIKNDNDSTHIECLHSVRAALILNALNEELLFDYCRALLITIQLVNSNVTQMIIDYLYSCGANEEFVNVVSGIEYVDIKTIEGVIRALLWFSVFNYLEINKETIAEGNRILNNQYLLMALTDLTGLIDTKNASMLDILEKLRPGTKDTIIQIIKTQPLRFFDYGIVKTFINKVVGRIAFLINNTEIDGNAAGYVLYWASLFGINISVDGIPRMLIEDEHSYLNLMKGLNVQCCTSVINEIKSKYEEKILTLAGIIAKYKRDEEVYAYVVNDLDNSEINKLTFNDVCMRAVYVLRVLEPDALRYNVELLGIKHNDFDVPDTEKHILNNSLNEKWITELNGIAIRMEDYSHAPMNWEEVFNKIVKYRCNTVELLSELTKVLDKYYQKSHAEVEKIKLLLDNWTSENPFAIPKCALDVYGIRDNTLIQNQNSDSNKQEFGIKRNYKQGGFEETIKKYSDSINNCIDNIGAVVDDLVNRRSDTQNYRLAYYNIVNAYEICKTLQEQFKEYFPAKKIEFDEQQELTVVQKTAALIRFIYHNGYSLQKNVLYNSNEEIKRKFRKIDEYFDAGLCEVVGVTRIERNAKSIIIRLCIDEYDDVLFDIYTSIKELIGKSIDISIEKAYLINRINCIELQITEPDGNELYYQRIPITKFAITDDYDKFKLFLSYSAERKDNKAELFIWVEFINSLEILFNTVMQINQRLSEAEECCINNTCRKRINNSYKKAFEELITYLIQNTTSNIEIMTQWIKSLEKKDLITADKGTAEEWKQAISTLQDIANGQVYELSKSYTPSMK